MTDDQIRQVLLGREARLRLAPREAAIDRKLLKVLAVAVAVNMAVVLPLLLWACRCSGG